MKELVELILLIAWVVGIVLAEGFWSTLFALINPLWSLIVLATHLLGKI